MAGPLEIFISYAHEDDTLREEFLKSLSQLQREHLIGDWHDRQLTGGTDFAAQIDERLNSARIIVLLVSPDFLASHYCYDIEMKRALERNDAGEARVVPVILRPCHWQRSPLGKLTALPLDGKPIVDWDTHDHGFLDAAEGVRRVAEKLLAPCAPDSIDEAKPRRRRLPVKAISIATGVVMILAAAWFWRAHQNRDIEKGDSALDIGRYHLAEGPYNDALRWSPLSTKAAVGVGIVKLADLQSDAVAFDRELARLMKQDPANPFLKILAGDSLLARGKATEAMQDYSAAVKIRPTLAEGWFRMGMVYDQQGRPGRALSSYEEAVKLSPSSPHYVDNLADQYFKHGQYDDAVKSLSTLDRFPLARLEMARIFRLTGTLEKAAESEQQAEGWLEDKSLLATVPENSDPWLIEGVRIPSRDQKICYARLSLSATLYLQGDQTGSARYGQLATQACGSQYLYIRGVLQSELERVRSERPELTKSVDAYSQVLLSWPGRSASF
jgi:tetratricopeptide (TPR) repeat protein